MPEFTKEQISEYREKGESAFHVLDSIAKRHISQFDLSRKANEMRTWPFIDYVANTIHKQYPFKAATLAGEKGFIIYQLLGSMQPGTYNCRFSTVLAGRIIDRLGYGDSPCLVIPLANEHSIWHVTNACFKDGHQYMMEFFIEGQVPTIDTDTFDFHTDLPLCEVSPQGLFELDQPFLLGNQRSLLLNR